MFKKRKRRYSFIVDVPEYKISLHKTFKTMIRCQIQESRKNGHYDHYKKWKDTKKQYKDKITLANVLLRCNLIQVTKFEADFASNCNDGLNIMGS